MKKVLIFATLVAITFALTTNSRANHVVKGDLIYIHDPEDPGCDEWWCNSSDNSCYTVITPCSIASDPNHVYDGLIVPNSGYNNLDVYLYDDPNNNQNYTEYYFHYIGVSYTNQKIVGYCPVY